MEIPTWRPKPDRRAEARIPRHDIARTTPEDGDVVLREETREGTLVYTLHTASGPEQQLHRSRRAGVAQALTSAKHACVRAWWANGGDFTLLEDFRMATVSDDVRKRLRAEFMEMPGLRLKPGQVQRLCSVEWAVCQLALDALVDEKFLCVRSDGHYTRMTDGSDVPRPKHAKADLSVQSPALRRA